MKEFLMKRAWAFRIQRGKDLMEELTRMAQEHRIELALVSFIGGLESAKVGYFRKELGQYQEISIPWHREILAGTGNVSVKDGKPFVHVHLILGDEMGHTFGGHALPGCAVFLAEGFFYELEGSLERKMDPNIRLAAWVNV